MIGQTIGKYRIVGQLGRGGMGTVYKAVDETLDREVAIKVLNPEVADAKIMTRFRAEATALARLNHPEIATIYELFRSETDLLMVMEFVRGETLDKISNRLGALPPDRAAYLLGKVLSALAHAHRAGIVHCDMKPGNVMVTEHGGVKIMDFGVSRVRGAGNPTTDGYMMGTPAYMPPEQVLGKKLDGRADLYAIGVILYRLLTATLPFKADTAIGMVQKQISEAPTPLSVYRNDLPEWCQRILDRALAKAPADRFQTAEEFSEALANAAGMVTTDAATAFFSSVVDLTETAPAPLGVVERFGVTSLSIPAAQANHADSPSPFGGRVDPPTGTLGHPTIVLRRKSFQLVAAAITGAGVLALIAVMALWRPGRTVATATQHGTTPAGASSKSGPAKGAAKLLPPEDDAPEAGRAGRVDNGESAKPAMAASATTKVVEMPLAFDASTLVPDGDRHRERDSLVVLAEGKISVRALDDRKLLHTTPYDAVVSISYSRGRNPFWNGPSGPTQVARTGRSPLGIFRGARHWLSLRLKSGKFLVLRLESEPQAWAAIANLEEKTRRKALFVEEPRDER
jgi:serine/threonine-protein kinase